MLWFKGFARSFYRSSGKLIFTSGNAGTTAGQTEKFYKPIMFSPRMCPTAMPHAFEERQDYNMNHISTLVFSPGSKLHSAALSDCAS